MTIKIFNLCMDSPEPFSYNEIDNLLSDGYEIINSATFVHGDIPKQRLMLRKDENAAAANAAAPVKSEVRAVVSIECRETYSSTAKQTFKFFTCVLENGDKVNVFNHPDESRNTFKIAENKGWGYLLNSHVGDNWTFETPVPVTVSHDGQWFSLVDIIHRDLWVDLEFDIADGESQDPYAGITPFENGKWYHESPDDSEEVKALRKSIDDIRSINFADDDDETDATDNAAAPDDNDATPETN